jgi:hypothetical protein
VQHACPAQESFAVPEIPSEILGLLDRLFPDDRALLDAVRFRVDDAMLLDIAKADWGQEIDENLTGLQQIRDAGEVPAPMEWEPQEVLGLRRWAEVDDTDDAPREQRERDHVERLFCCAALLAAAAKPENLDQFLGENQTLARAIDSALFLGRDVSDAALRFVAWRAPQMRPDDEERPFFALGILLLFASLNREEAHAPNLQALAEWVFTEEARVHARWVRYAGDSVKWLLGLTYHDLDHNRWRALARRVLLEGHPALPLDRAPAVREIAACLLE